MSENEPGRPVWAIWGKPMGVHVDAPPTAEPAQPAPAADAVPVAEGMPNAGHPLLQRLCNSIEIVDGMACVDFSLVYDLRDHLAAMEALRQKRTRLSDYVNSANILGSDMPAEVVRKLQAAIDAGGV